ncbi:MAG: hypothetical protein GXZ16_05380, partial [Spirochaetales bacterium]|nr:hypothetical protein [Spirochaetales bacterium]
MDKHNTLSDRQLRHAKNALIVITIVVILAVLKWSREVSIVIVLSIFLFLLLNPIARKLEKAKIPPILATIISMLVLLMVIFTAIIFFFYAVDLLIRT